MKLYSKGEETGLLGGGIILSVEEWNVIGGSFYTSYREAFLNIIGLIFLGFVRIVIGPLLCKVYFPFVGSTREPLLQLWPYYFLGLAGLE